MSTPHSPEANTSSAAETTSDKKSSLHNGESTATAPATHSAGTGAAVYATTATEYSMDVAPEETSLGDVSSSSAASPELLTSTDHATAHELLASPVASPEPTSSTASAAETASASTTGKKNTFTGSFFTTHPVLAIPESMPPSVFSRLFNALAYAPWIFLTALLVAQCIFSLDARSLWYSDEIRHADAFRNLLLHNKWIVLQLNGELYPDKPPLYFWFLRGLYAWLQTDGPRLFFTATALSALAYLWSFFLLGRFVARTDGRTLLASGILLMSSAYLVGLVHYSRMDLLFSAVILCSYTALYHALIRPRSFLYMGLAFGLGGIACLIKGPFGIALPLCAGFLFILWRGTPLRLFKMDVFAGLALLLCIVGAWVAGIYFTVGQDFLVNTIIGQQVIQRATNTFHHAQRWYYYLAVLPLLLLPWTFLLICLPFERFFNQNNRKAIAATRTPDAEGLGYLWCIVLSAMLLLSAMSGKIHIYILPALPALAIILARTALSLSGFRAALFRHCTALFLLLSGAAVIVAALALFGDLELPPLANLPQWRLTHNPAFYYVGGGLVTGAAALWFILRTSRPEGVLLIVSLMFTGLAYPLATLSAPSFDAVLSPKNMATHMRTFIEAGYQPVSFDDYGGTFSYYTGHTITEVSKNEKERLTSLMAGGKIVLAIRRSHWEKWENKPECFKEVMRQWIESKEYLLLACPPLGSAKEQRPVEAAKESPPPAPPVAGTISPAPPAREAISPAPQN